MTVMEITTLLYYAIAFSAGGSTGYWWRHLKRIRTSYPELPIVSDGQSVTVTFIRGGVEISNRSVHSSELKDILTRPKGGAPREHYRFSHIDEKGRFVYIEEL